MFADKTIEKRVMAIVKARITRGQEEYDSGVETLEAQLEDDKVKLADKVVQSIVGKFL